MTKKLMLGALIVLVLCTGLGFKASCAAPPTEWRLTVKTTGHGNVDLPGVGMFWYPDGEDVILTAYPAPGYRFVNWTGKVGTIEDVYHAATRIHMTLDYTITANFAPLP